MDRWEHPYKDAFASKRKTRGLSGVYLIKEHTTGLITYIGMSKSCVYKALYRHFQRWDDPYIKRITYSERERYYVRVILLDKHRVDYTERRLIRYFQPLDNREMYASDSCVAFPDYESFESVLGSVRECTF